MISSRVTILLLWFTALTAYVLSNVLWYNISFATVRKRRLGRELGITYIDGLFCYRGEQRNGAKTMGFMRSRESFKMGAVTAYLQADGNKSVERGTLMIPEAKPLRSWERKRSSKLVRRLGNSHYKRSRGRRCGYGCRQIDRVSGAKFSSDLCPFLVK